MMAAELTPHETALINVLDRKTNIDALRALMFSLRPEPSTVSLASTAIAFDANVFLRLSTHKRSVDVIDYIRSSHSAPIILPGQAIQEFWNNQFVAVDSMASAIRKNFEKLKGDIEKIDTAFAEFSAKFQAQIEDFSSEYGHVFDAATISRTNAFLEVLADKASVPFVRRSVLHEIARHRKLTKTPPGFKDDGDGDFFIWADLLTGIQTAMENGADVQRVVLVSHDRKIDWSREGTPHPILAAEVQAIAGVPFEIWSIDDLIKQVVLAI
ncbi:PIN-like domain-containing protein [Brevundimonas diminuta]|uniref:PIN-like domain-containing protein n=1 Tax=Brevundimonas diminuta TaxID=293 RepID=UPI003207DCB9